MKITKKNEPMRALPILKGPACGEPYFLKNLDDTSFNFSKLCLENQG